MNIRFAPAIPADATTIAILVPADGIAAATGDRPEAAAAAKVARFDGAAGELAEVVRADGRGGHEHVIMAGVGQRTPADFEKAGGAIAARLMASGVDHVVVDASGADEAAVLRLASALSLRAWRHDEYRTTLDAKKRVSLTGATIVHADTGIAARWDGAAGVVEGVTFTRTLVTEPANILYPESFVERCAMLRDHGVEIQVLDEDAMRAAGMGALLGVSQGSARAPRMLVMRWDGSAGAQATPVVFIGKGVTFDTGGISLKPPAGMEDMKWDMGGAGAVAGAMLALARRNAKAHVVGICALVENMPDGKAQRPGDVVTSMSGKTIEVINTDAEGRLVLCDAITWAQANLKPKVIVDLATLTGAMIISLGHEHGGIFSNDDALAGQLVAAGAAVGDPLWRFPLGAAYDRMIDSPIADMKNVGPREAGSITAAQFLQRFIDDGVAWAHLDIAGMVWAAKPGTTFDKGATGFGVRLLDRFIADHHEG